MTDEQHDSIEQENKTPTTDKTASEIRATDEIDVESALAAISSLHTLVTEEELDDVDDEDLVDDDASDDVLVVAEDEDDDEFESFASEPVTDDYEYAEVQTIQSDFARPPVSVLHRGQLASIVPAALLIGSGALMTVILTTSTDATLNFPVVSTLAVSGVGVAMIAQWLSSSRWTTGSFFIGMLLLLVGAITTYLILPTSLDMARGYPLIITAIGTAFVVTDLVSPTKHRLWLVGLVFAIAGFAGLVITAQLLPETIVTTVSQFLPVVLVVVVLLLIVPIFRRNGQ